MSSRINQLSNLSRVSPGSNASALPCRRFKPFRPSRRDEVLTVPPRLISAMCATRKLSTTEASANRTRHTCPLIRKPPIPWPPDLTCVPQSHLLTSAPTHHRLCLLQPVSPPLSRTMCHDLPSTPVRTASPAPPCPPPMDPWVPAVTNLCLSTDWAA